MIDYLTGLDLVLDRARSLPAEKVSLDRALGRVLARRVTARMDMPRFDQSAMDGYAVRLADVARASSSRPVELDLTGVLPAGSSRRLRLEPGCAVKVFTGSRLPAGTGAVVMKEYCREEGDSVRIEHAPREGEHLRRKGEEYTRGSELLRAGVRLTPPAVGLLATNGCAEVPVHALPSVALITIGDELVRLGKPLAAGKIYNSNAFALSAALTGLGLGRVSAGTLPDDRATLGRTLRRRLRGNDVLITVGGVSVGDFDFVRSVAAEVGVEEVFWKLAVKPGKPCFFGTWRPPGSRGRSSRRLVFGLPGNPVSALVSFHLLVKPALLKMMGLPAAPPVPRTARLDTDCRKEPGRLEFLRGVLREESGSRGDPILVVHPVTRQESHMIGGLAGADCLILFPRQATRLKRGQRVEILPLCWT